jgi:hypothetical protein
LLNAALVSLVLPAEGVCTAPTDRIPAMDDKSTAATNANSASP